MRIALEVRRLVLALSDASDDALARVVAMVDALPERALAEGLLAPMRPRLRGLRPPRPLQVTRLLFLPLEGAIRPTPAWQPGGFHLPRSALRPLADQLRAAAPEAIAALEAEAAGHGFDEAERVGRLGRQLWSLAAEAMPDAAITDWTAATGLAAAHEPALRALCRGVWRHAGPIWDAAEAAPSGPPEALARTALAGPWAESPAVFAASLATLLRLARRPGVVAGAAAALGPGSREIAEQGLAESLEAARPPLEAADPAGSAVAVNRFADMLADLEGAPLCQAESWQERLATLRREADRACRASFALAIDTRLVTPARSLAEAASDAAVERIEATARELKRLEAAGRRLGGTGSYDGTLRALAAALLALRDAATPAGLTPMDLARLGEILCGRNEAHRLLATRDDVMAAGPDAPA